MLLKNVCSFSGVSGSGFGIGKKFEFVRRILATLQLIIQQWQQPFVLENNKSWLPTIVDILEKKRREN